MCPELWPFACLSLVQILPHSISVRLTLQEGYLIGSIGPNHFSLPIMLMLSNKEHFNKSWHYVSVECDTTHTHI